MTELRIGGWALVGLLGLCGLAAADCGGASAPDNRPPFFASTPPAQATVYFPYVYEMACGDPDGDLVTLARAQEDTCGGTVTDAGDRTARYELLPGTGDAGTSCVVAVVCADPAGHEVRQSAPITVAPGPEPEALVFSPFAEWADPLADYHDAAMHALSTRQFLWGIHDLAVWQDRLYLGYGDANVNVGRLVPIEIRSFPEPQPTACASEFVTDEEQIDRYRIAGDRLVIPGVDATEDGLLGNAYTLDATGWTKRRSLQWGWHVHDVADHDGSLYAVGSGGSLEDYHDSTVNAYLWRMGPGEERFEVEDVVPHPSPPGDNRLVSLLEAAGELYAFGYYSTTDTTHPTAFRLGAAGLEPWAGLASFFVLGTQPASPDQGLVWGVEIGSTLRQGARRVDASGAHPIGSLAGLTVLDAAPLGQGRLLLLLLDGDAYPAPDQGPFALSVAVLGADGSLDPLVEQTLSVMPESLAFWQRHLYLGLTDGRLLRAEGDLP